MQRPSRLQIKLDMRSPLIPYLDSSSGGHQLIVRGQPFLILGAELQNSSSSCPAYMRSIWSILKSHNVNTVLLSVGWETIEPQEGTFDFTKLDEIILDARQHELHLILLWFGAFKNGKSAYAPAWVKTDTRRFPRAMLRTSASETQLADVLSVFHHEVVEADATAFGMLMQHIKEFDHDDSTVLMVQVENEVGLLGDSRDVAPEATKRFLGTVPEQLEIMLTKSWDVLHPSLRKNLSSWRQRASGPGSPSWNETLGPSLQTDELFMAYYYALYVEQVAKRGKSKYPLPMFTNVWQNYADEDADKSQPIVVGGGGAPGDYPSGGGVINVLDIWQHFAPSLDFIAPDVYLNDYAAVCAKYRHRGQPLFIPEQRRDDYGARRVWVAYGTYHALCASPFAIDTLDPAKGPWNKHYRLLAQVADYVLAAQRNSNLSVGFCFDDIKDNQRPSDTIFCRLGNWNLSVERSFTFGKPAAGFGMVIQLDFARFLLIGEGFQVRFTSAEEDSAFTGILSFVEKVHDSRTNKLIDGRTLNGDETRSGEAAIMPAENPDLGEFPICITIPARTCMAECVVYALASNSP